MTVHVDSAHVFTVREWKWGWGEWEGSLCKVEVFGDFSLLVRNRNPQMHQMPPGWRPRFALLGG